MKSDPSPAFPGLRRFTLVPDDQRTNQVRSLSARLFVGKWQEHREAAAFLDTMTRAHGQGVDTLVRSLLFYRDYLAGLKPDEDPQGSLFEDSRFQERLNEAVEQVLAAREAGARS